MIFREDVPGSTIDQLARSAAGKAPFLRGPDQPGTSRPWIRGLGTGEQIVRDATHGDFATGTTARALPILLRVIVLWFLLLQLVPGDAADVLAAEKRFGHRGDHDHAAGTLTASFRLSHGHPNEPASRSHGKSAPFVKPASTISSRPVAW